MTEQSRPKLPVAAQAIILIILTLCTGVFDFLLLSRAVVINFYLVSAIFILLGTPAILLGLRSRGKTGWVVKILVAIFLLLSAGIYLIFLAQSGADLADVFAGNRSFMFTYLIPLGVGHYVTVVVLSIPKHFRKMPNRKKNIWGGIVFVVIMPLAVLAMIGAALLLKNLV